MKYGEVENSELFSRENLSANVEETVAEIIENVKTNGDKALFEYCEKFDGVTLSSLVVTEEEIEKEIADLAAAYNMSADDV